MTNDVNSLNFYFIYICDTFRRERYALVPFELNQKNNFAEEVEEGIYVSFGDLQFYFYTYVDYAIDD